MVDDSGQKKTGNATAWRTAWLKAVAKSWKDPAFGALLQKDPRAALKQIGYDLPANVNLQVQPADAPDQGYMGDAGWSLPAAEATTSSNVVMPLPPSPTDINDQAVALASLNDWCEADACCGDPCCC